MVVMNTPVRDMPSLWGKGGEEGEVVDEIVAHGRVSLKVICYCVYFHTLHVLECVCDLYTLLLVALVTLGPVRSKLV